MNAWCGRVATVGDSPRTRAKAWGRLVATKQTDVGYREIRRNRDGILTGIAVERDPETGRVYVETVELDESSADDVMLGWWV